MQRSKPGRKLTRIIKPWTDRIYYRDPKRYERLCQWVWFQQSEGWPDEAIAKALSMGDGRVDDVKDWWRYLTALLPKAKGKAVGEESEEYKKSDLTKVKAILRKMKE